MPDLLIELFSEEIPARMQGRAADDLKRLVTDGLVDAGLAYASAGAFATPRRLVLTVEELPARSPDTREERKGPRADAPERAITGFLRATGLSRDQLETRSTKKGDVLFAVVEKPGRPAAEIVAEVLETTIRNFPWPRSMRWGSGALRWVRPLHSLLCILSDDGGAEVVPLEIDGIRSGDTTRGHRFMAPETFAVTSFADYRENLARARVVLDAAERAERIRHDAANLAFARGLEVVEDRGLLAEVAGLVEWPVVLMGDIAAEFLSLPPEVLQTSMRTHQKFFSVRNAKTGRIEKFVTVANIETPDQGATILAGNRKVLAARLSDARFFWENDLRVAREEQMRPWIAALENVTFHNRLGSQGERIARLRDLAHALTPFTGADSELAATAAAVAKADLASGMVYEFPELQGIMGRYYAEAAGLPPEAAAACEEHYAPLGPADRVPRAPVSVSVALADKLDMLTGFWAIGEKPTGSKDPFALRRAALGVIRILLENDLRLPLRQAFAATPHKADADDLLAFFHDRLKVWLKERNIRHDVIDAVLAMPGNDDLTLLVRRAEALTAFLATEEGANLIQGFRRANNILRQAEERDGVEYSFGPDPKFAETDAEKELFAALDAAGPRIERAMHGEDFTAAMAEMARLRAPIDTFFEAVQINTDNAVVRRNRLNLLNRIREICLGVADLSRIGG